MEPPLAGAPRTCRRRPSARILLRRLPARAAWAGAVLLLLGEVLWVTVSLHAHRAPAVEEVRWSGAAAPPAWEAAVDPTGSPSAVGGSGSGSSRASGGVVGPGRVEGWARRLAPRTGIPEVALAAYGSAELTLAAERPGCHLSWAALAGIGSVESDHGRHGGAVLQVDGTSIPPIIGVPLDGHGVAVVRDSDGGSLDGDGAYDRAVGPMQFLPATWRLYGADGDGDGLANPNSLPDAALAAGRYLCRSGGGDLRTATAWTSAVLAYNASRSYLSEVTARGNAYATRSLAR